MAARPALHRLYSGTSGAWVHTSPPPPYAPTNHGYSRRGNGVFVVLIRRVLSWDVLVKEQRQLGVV